MPAEQRFAQAVKDPDAAQAKKLMAEIEGLVTDLGMARLLVAEALGEGRDMVPMAGDRPRALQRPTTALGRSFFPDAFQKIATARMDAGVLVKQAQALRGKL